MQTLTILLTGIGLGSMVLLIAKLLKDYRQLVSARIMMLIFLGAGAYVLRPLIDDAWFKTVLEVMASAVPPLFWLFTVSFFQTRHDPEGLRPVHYLVIAISMSVSVSICVQHTLGAEGINELLMLDHVIKFALVSIGLVNVLKNWRNDLVECRRRMRVGLTVITGVFLLFALTNAMIYNGQPLPAQIVFINVLITALLGLYKAFWILNSNPEELLEAVDKLPDELSKQIDHPPPPLDVADMRWLEDLNHCMQEDAYYRNNDLTIRSLSQHIGVPEHHVRRLINQHLGYRNFNEYLNHFRIREASTRLLDPEQARLPITTIAIESGYGSLTTFNKAFKALKDMTPTEFRRENLVPELTDS